VSLGAVLLDGVVIIGTSSCRMRHCGVPELC
jgi:hypothetical protein